MRRLTVSVPTPPAESTSLPSEEFLKTRFSGVLYFPPLADCPDCHRSLRVNGVGIRQESREVVWVLECPVGHGLFGRPTGQAVD